MRPPVSQIVLEKLLGIQETSPLPATFSLHLDAENRTAPARPALVGCPRPGFPVVGRGEILLIGVGGQIQYV